MQPSASNPAELARLGTHLEQHRERLTRMIDRRMTAAIRGRFSAEDVIQETFREATQQWTRSAQPGDGTREPTAFTWLYRVALQKYIDTFRAATADLRDARKDWPLPEDSVLQIGRGFIADNSGPLSHLQQQEMAQMVLVAMSELNERDRNIILMRVVDELTFGEISELLEVSENTAAVTFARSLRRLRDACKRKSDDFESASG
jgi:RNA polymerase sigma-70 factor, ECF subfamily